jgi:hypothetical protein
MSDGTPLVVSVYAGKEQNLSELQQPFLEALLDRIKRAGFRVRTEPAQSDGVEERLEAIRRSHGVIVVAFSQWEGHRLSRNQKKAVIFPSEFAHMACVMAVASKRPMLVLREKSVADRGVFRTGYVRPIIDFKNCEIAWLDGPEFRTEFNKWTANVNQQKHVFLGYSSKAEPTAALIRKFLTETLHLRVFDWHDFQSGQIIWDSIERAERLTDSGIFLFMADDKLGQGKAQLHVPRDNVVYEAGYFAGAKGRSQSLIIREEGAKIPSDLGGILYLQLPGRNDIAAIESKLREHLKRMVEKDRGA